jgi:hypothetical protein
MRCRIALKDGYVIRSFSYYVTLWIKFNILIASIYMKERLCRLITLLYGRLLSADVRYYQTR